MIDNVKLPIQVLESLEHAMRRDAPILAEYLGGAVNSDAYHMTDPRPDGCGVSLCIRRSLDDAGVAPEEVRTKCYCLTSKSSLIKIAIC
jgi:3-oxoacyl-(acyl-carrier-protein) synthase